MDQLPSLDLPARQRILRRLLGQTFAVIVVLLMLDLAFAPSATPLWARSVATAAVLLVGVVVTEIFLRLAAKRFPSMQLPRLAIVVAAVLASLVGFTVALVVQSLLGYPPPITWVTLLEAFVSAPVWLVFIGSITAARWRYLAGREVLLRELVSVEEARLAEREALARARLSVADSVRPNLVELRANIDTALSAAGDELQKAAVELRDGASAVLRPLSHELYAQVPRPTPRGPLRFLGAVMRTQPFRLGLVVMLYLATALPGNVSEYGVADASVALALDVVFIMAILGGANLLMKRVPKAHLTIYVGTLIAIHAIPLVLALPNVADTDPQFSGLAVVMEIAASLFLLLGTSSLGLVAARRETVLAELQAELKQEQLAELAEASVLAEAARELGARLHGPVQSSVLASAAALERAVSDGETDRAHSVLVQAAAAIDAALSDAAGGEVAAEGDLKMLLEEVAEPWREICPVRLVIDPQLRWLTGAESQAAAVIVREAVTNAFRHGQATGVDVVVTGTATEVHLVISDNGVGPGPKNWGLGLTLIDRYTNGHWTLVREGDTTVLTASIDGAQPPGDSNRN